MKSAEEFLKQLRTARESASQRTSSLLTHEPEIEVNWCLTAALKRGWLVAPVLARSKNFLRGALAGHPTRDSAQVSDWWKQYKSDCNWAAELGAHSHLLILEFDYDVGRQMLPHLCGESMSWRKTLQFTDATSRFACFNYSGEHVRAIGSNLPGVHLHTRNCILIPPSTDSTGARVSYLNPGSRVLDLPDWLLDSGRTNNPATNPYRNDDEDYFAA
jgi:hypothetical protein